MIELSISTVPALDTLIYFRNESVEKTVQLAESWIDENLAGRLSCSGDPVAAEAIATFRSSIRRRLLGDGPSVDPMTGVGQDAAVNEALAVAWLATTTPNQLN